MKDIGQVIRKKRYKVGVSKYSPESTRTGADCKLQYQL